jgi:hypothetical protein
MPRKSQPREDGIPKWANTKIRKLSKNSGVSYDKILLLVLRFGLYQVKEELTPVMNLMQSAEHLEDENEEQPEQRPPVQEPDSIPAGFTVIDHGGTSVEEGSDYAGERRGEYGEGYTSDDVPLALTGE